MLNRSAVLLALFTWAHVHMSTCALGQGTYQLAVLKYRGGGDWYANPTAVPNLVRFCNQELGTSINPEVPVVDVGSAELFNYPWVHMTGHGNVVLDQQEADNLRAYLIGGGFLHISDNYGMDPFVRPMLQRVFPELELVELPFGHPIYHQKFSFPKGLPKIHEHDDLPARGYALIRESRVVCFYDHECDLGDGWEDPDVHGNSPETRQKALRMGANIVQYAFGGKE